MHRLYAPLLGLIIVFGCLRIVATYGHFWQTWDEPAHVAAGLQWWEKGRITHERLHPPLARIAMAAGPYFAGVRGTADAPDHWTDGNALLHRGRSYERNLAFARLGILPFFVIASLVVAAWTARCAGREVSLVAVLLFSLLPPVMAHAGLASLDMACAAMVAAALFAFVLWLEKPDAPRTLFLGTTVGLAVTAKFSAFAFLSAGFSALILLWCLGMPDGSERSVSRRLRSLLLALAVAATSVWIVYRFSLGTIEQSGAGQNLQAVLGALGPAAPLAGHLAATIPLPAVDFFWGLFDVVYFRQDEGHLAYFLGDIGKRGWWLFYPVLLLVKTPVTFLVLAGLGVYAGLRHCCPLNFSRSALVPLAGAAAVMVAGIFFTPHNGLRQILAVYPLVAVVAGCGFAQLWRSPHRTSLSRFAAVVLVAACAANSFAVHPDYLSYFNFMAGRNPASIAADSDLDWGQDLKPLAQACRRLGVNELALQYNGSKGIDLSAFDLPKTTELPPYERLPGWVAVSRQKILLGTGDPPYNQFAWLAEEKPVEEIGNSILLFRFGP